MNIAVSDHSTASEEAGEVLAEAVGTLAVEVLGALLDALGVEGLAVLLAVGAVVLTVKSKTLRRAEARAARWAVRAAWWAVVAVVTAAGWRRAGLEPSRDERRLLGRLAPEHWRRHAEARGLDGTLTARPRLTPAGIVCAVRLDGRWTVKALRERSDAVRALLGVRADVRLEIEPGRRGGWAELALRTRSALDGADMRWTPGVEGVGLDLHTGKPVPLPVGRLLLAGSSGAGKSVTLRPWLAALAADDRSAVVFVDLKRVEGALWRPRARVAVNAAEVEAVAVELQAEMMARLTELETTGRASWRPTAERPRVVVVVDEGAEVVGVAPKSLPAFESVARMGRAAEIHLVWCTQRPSLGDGIPRQVAAQMDVRAALRLASATETRIVLGEDATAGGWDAHTLPKPGVLLLRGTGRGPSPVRVWFMDDKTLRGLPSAPVWHGPGGRPVEAVSGPQTAVQAPAVAVEQAPVVEPVEGPEERILAALANAGAGGLSTAEVRAAAGLGKTRAAELLAALVDDGRVIRPRHGRYALAPVEDEGAAA